MGIHILKGDTEPIRIILYDAEGQGITGATVTLRILRSADSYFWNGGTFQSGEASVSMTEENASALPGYYVYNWPSTGQNVGRYLAVATTSEAQSPVKEWAEDLTLESHELDEAMTSHTAAGTVGGYLNSMKKFICNKLAISGTVFSVKEDDGVTEFASGTITETERTPD